MAERAIALGDNIVVTSVDLPNRIVHIEAHLSDLGPTKGEKGNHAFATTRGNKGLPGFPQLSCGINIYGPEDALAVD